MYFAGFGVHEHNTDNVASAEQTDGLIQARNDPVGLFCVVDFKGRIVKQIRRIAETNDTLDMTAEVICQRIADRLIERALLADIRRVDDAVAGDRVLFDDRVGEPLDDVGIPQHGQTNGTAFVVDLGEIGGSCRAVIDAVLTLQAELCQITEGFVRDLGG